MAGTVYVPEHHDEALDGQGRPRPLYTEILSALEAADLATLQGRVHEQITDREITFVSGEDEEAIPLDPVPRLLGGTDWGLIAAGLEQRARALGAFLADAYGPRRIVEAGVVPENLITSAELYEPILRDVQRRDDDPLIAGFDLVRNPEGEFIVLEDNLRTPSGFSYIVEVREVVDRMLPREVREKRLDPSGFQALLRNELERARPQAGPEGIAVLSEGPGSSARFEHGNLAEALGAPLLEPGDLRQEDGLVIADGPDGPEPVGVLMRRTDEDRLTDEKGRPTELAEILLEPIRQGTVRVVNAFGNGVADDKLAHAYVDEMIRYYLDEEPRLGSVRTFDLTDPDIRATVLDDIGRMVVKPRSGTGGEDVIVCAHAAREDVERARRLVADEPEAWVAQEFVQLSTHPTLSSGGLEPRHVDLRAFTIGAKAAPAALTRFAPDRDAVIVNSSQGGGCKDTWILHGNAPDAEPGASDGR